MAETPATIGQVVALWCVRLPEVTADDAAKLEHQPDTDALLFGWSRSAHTLPTRRLAFFERQTSTLSPALYRFAFSISLARCASRYFFSASK